MDAGFPPTGPLLAVDWGTRRIGLAISDETRTIAHPLATLTRRTGRRFPLARLRPFLTRYQPTAILIGLPLEPGGSEGDACREARALGDLLHQKTGLPVGYVDERMSTARALSAAREMGVAHPARREHADQMAATAFLQQYLDAAS